MGRRRGLRAGTAGSKRWVGAMGMAALGLAVALCSPAAHAASEDAAVSSAVQHVLSEEYAQASFGEAKRKLTAALDRCSRARRCSGATKAQAHVAIGMVESQVGNKAEATTQFVTALKEDPNAKLPATGTSPDIRNLFADAQKQLAPPEAVPPPAPAPIPVAAPMPTPIAMPAAIPVAAPQPVAPPPAPVQVPLPAPAPAPAPAATEEPPPVAEKPTRTIAGWSSTEAFELASAAVAADQVGKLDECIEKNRASLKLEEQPRTRLHLASCETRSGKLIDALGDSQKALKFGIEKRDVLVMKAARARLTDLLGRIPHVTFVPPPGATDLTVAFDERPVPIESLTKKFSVDPGKHVVHAEGTLNSIPLQFDKEYEIKEAELVTVQIVLVSQAPEYLTPGQLKCMLAAKSQEEVLKCLPQNRKNLVVKAGFDVSGYSDTNHVNVFTPAINGSVSSPTQGWNVGGSYLVDVVTAASPDIVSEASTHFREVRHAGSLTGGYKPGLYGGQVTANVSSEPDYLSTGAGIALIADLRDKLLTPRLAYSYSHDLIGRTGSLSAYHKSLDTNEFEAGVTMVLSPTSLLLVSATAQFERGDQSKPYRYVPMFDQSVAPRVPVGGTVDLVNGARLPLRPLEQLPTERDRYAIGARFAHRFGNATLRLEQRLYYDTWALKATTTDARYVIDMLTRLRVWPHLRFNAQTGASFYQLAYSAAILPDGTLVVPTYRTGDRELSPLVTATAGGGGRFALTSPAAKTQYGISLQGDVMYTRFFNALFVTTRTAIYGTVGIDAEFE